MVGKFPPPLKLLYFSGCPRVSKLRAMLKKLNVEFVEMRREALPANHPFTKYSSPTVLCGEEIIFGSKLNENSEACSLEPPSLDELRERLKSIFV